MGEAGNGDAEGFNARDDGNESRHADGQPIKDGRRECRTNERRKRQHDEYECHGVNGDQYRNREFQNERQPRVAEHHADDGKKEGPTAVGKRGADAVKVVRAAGNESHAGIETRNEEHESDDDGARGTEKCTGCRREKLSVAEMAREAGMCERNITSDP